MKPLRTLALLGATAAAVTVPTVQPASAYAVDCAILLCLAGGWPTSPECAAAHAVFIARITPWPVEPPLQVWRCPMGAAYDLRPEDMSPMGKLYRVMQTVRPAAEAAAPLGPISAAYRPSDAPWQGPRARPVEAVIQSYRRGEISGAELIRVATEGEYSSENGTADIDISGSDFAFVRSIHVYDVDWYQYWRGGEDDSCHTPKSRVRLGSYGRQGDFSWSNSRIAEMPSWMTSSLRDRGGYDCTHMGRMRAIGIDWTDVSGKTDHELVEY